MVIICFTWDLPITFVKSFRQNTTTVSESSENSETWKNGKGERREEKKIQINISVLLIDMAYLIHTQWTYDQISVYMGNDSTNEKWLRFNAHGKILMGG